MLDIGNRRAVIRGRSDRPRIKFSFGLPIPRYNHVKLEHVEAKDHINLRCISLLIRNLIEMKDYVILVIIW